MHACTWYMISLSILYNIVSLCTVIGMHFRVFPNTTFGDEDMLQPDMAEADQQQPEQQQSLRDPPISCSCHHCSCSFLAILESSGLDGIMRLKHSYLLQASTLCLIVERRLFGELLGYRGSTHASHPGHTTTATSKRQTTA